MKTNRPCVLKSVLLVVVLLMLTPCLVVAHCDGMDGPVVKAAQKALETGDVKLVLIWVTEEDEAEIRNAFDRTLEVRNLSPETRDLADMYFFETLVRIHRAGEGAPYTGLKPAGQDLGPAIPLADKVLDSGEIEDLVELITGETRRGLIERFEHAIEARNYEPGDVEAGREFVHAYVNFIHYAERAFEAAHQEAAGHFPESGQAGAGHDE